MKTGFGLASGIVVAALLCGCANRQTIERGQVAVSFPRGERAFGEYIASEGGLPLALFALDGSAEGFPARDKEEDLALVSRLLGRDAPSPRMRRDYDHFAERFEEISAAALEKVSIYRYEDVKERLKRGEKVEGLSYDAATDSVGWSIELRLVGGGEKSPGSGSGLALPIVLKPEDRVDLEARRRVFREMVGNARSLQEAGAPDLQYFILLHEVAELEIISTVIKSPDRRWFADGMANCVALLALRSGSEGMSIAELFARYSPPPSDLCDWIDSTDPESWLAAEFDETGGDRLTLYYISTLAIAKAIEAHGEGFIPELFQRLRGLDYESAAIDDVYRVFDELNGVDLRRYLTDSVAEIRQRCGSGEATRERGF